jgi:hypothetical protein
LSNSTITGIECIDNTQLASYAQEGAGTFDLLTPAQHAYGVLYLVDHKDTVLAQMPLYSLLSSVQSDKVTRFNTKINVRSCYIIWSDVSGFSASNGIVFRFYFNER